jgi:hypothetical protein
MFDTARVSSLLAAAALVGACAGAPVQTLSDARQTITAAEAAGAADKAPLPYGQALEELHRAEDGLKRGDYRAASREAENAHKAALQALHEAQGPAALPPPQ